MRELSVSSKPRSLPKTVLDFNQADRRRGKLRCACVSTLQRLAPHKGSERSPTRQARVSTRCFWLLSVVPLLTASLCACLTSGIVPCTYIIGHSSQAVLHLSSLCSGYAVQVLQHLPLCTQERGCHDSGAFRRDVSIQCAPTLCRAGVAQLAPEQAASYVTVRAAIHETLLSISKPLCTGNGPTPAQGPGCVSAKCTSNACNMHRQASGITESPRARSKALVFAESYSACAQVQPHSLARCCTMLLVFGESCKLLSVGGSSHNPGVLTSLISRSA